MEKSESIKNIASALMEFQSNMPAIPKNSVNPFFKSKYANLSTVIEKTQQPLVKAGLSYSQIPEGKYLTTLLMHPESGEYLASNYDLSLIKDDPQGMGSAITYARRYALAAMLGLNIDDDDDANAASPKPNAKPSTTNTDYIKSYQLDRIKQLVTEAGGNMEAMEEAIMKSDKCKIDKLTSTSANMWIKKLEKKVALKKQEELGEEVIDVEVEAKTTWPKKNTVAPEKPKTNVVDESPAAKAMREAKEKYAAENKAETAKKVQCEAAIGENERCGNMLSDAEVKFCNTTASKKMLCFIHQSNKK